MSLNGEDLVKTFNNFNVVIGNSSQNVINGWFDTDDPQMKHLLNWLCTNLTEDNHISAIEHAEYSQLTTVYEGENLQKEIDKIEEKLPGLFDVEWNLFQTELITDEIQLEEEKLRELNKTLKTNEKLQNNLASELSLVTSQQIKALLKREEAQENCLNKAKQLDGLNGKLYDQILKYSQYLYNFQFSEIPYFISNLNVANLEEKFENLTVFFKSLKISRNSDKTSFLDVTTTVSSDLEEVKARIAESSFNRLIAVTEIEKLNAILQFLSKYNTEQMFTFVDHSRLQSTVEWKREQKNSLLAMLKNNCDKTAENTIVQPKLITEQNVLSYSQLKLKCLNNIYNGMAKILANVTVLKDLFMQESNDISCTDQLFRNVITYINKDLQNCFFRTESMTKVIEEYQSYNSNVFISRLSDLLGTKNNIYSVLDAVTKLKNNVKSVETNLFVNNTKDHLNQTNQLKINSEKLKKLLISGPTSRIITIPHELCVIFHETDLCLENENKSLKAAVQIYSNTLTKLAEDKWLRIRRQLWMYFINNPEKLLSLLKEVEKNGKV